MLRNKTPTFSKDTRNLQINEMNDFYKEVSKYPIDKIICLVVDWFANHVDVILVSLIKTYIKKKRDVYSFEELAKNVDTSIEKYQKIIRIILNMLTTKKTKYTRKPSTRKHKLKLYKDVLN